MPATEVVYGFIPGWLILALAIAIGVGLFLRDAYRLFRLMRLGRSERRTDQPLQRTVGWVLNVLAQARLLSRTYPGVMHALIFWGFLVITLSTIEIFGRGLWSGFRLPFISDTGAFLYLVDTFQLLVLVGIGMALYRRIAVKPWYLNLSGDAIIILSLISTLMITAFLQEGFAIAAAMWHPEPAFNRDRAFVGTFLARFLVRAGYGADLAGHIAFWWLHVLTLLGFLAYLPHSKHLHIVTAPFNVWLRRLSPKGQLPYQNVEEALEHDEPIGVSEINHLTWKDLLDSYTCTECGRCTSECPASISGKPLSPKDLILNLRHYLLERGPQLLARSTDAQIATTTAHGEAEQATRVLVGDVITDEVLWDCTTCRACVDACPVFIDHVPKIVEMRRHLVMGESRIGKDLQSLFENLEATGNPWRFPRARRADWAAGLEIPTIEEAPDAQVLYWVGCFGSFDDRSKKVAQAFSRLMRRAGVSFAILGNRENCTGDPARRAGNEYLYQMLAAENVETLNEATDGGKRTIVTACPHCFNTISDEYPQFGGAFRVMHHTQFLAQLLAERKLKPEVGKPAAISYHDPCYLGRYHDTYDEPRQLLEAIPGVTLREIAPCREKAMCCGAGGAHAFMEETRGRRINHIRLEQAMAVEPERMATACPYCLMMFEDATGAKGVADTLPVRDVAELIEASLGPADEELPAAD
ncbi:MAG TPA: heterodisulfide reductase-related iron-sulfur binding cluster [Chloroflexota bacterium]|nr:heterodisulfide reductase-related iron-sulfur binding cluster [Chloroflexota bacterium]